MIMKAYSIFDAKAETYMLPFFQHSDPLAQRAFIANVQSTGSMMAQFPEDFFLYQVGEYDDTNGHYTSCERRLVLTGSDAHGQG